MEYDFLASHPDGTLVYVWVVPNASRDEIVGLHGERLKVKVSAPAEGGKATRKVAHLVATAVGGKRGVLVDGRTSRRKAILVTGVDVGSARAALSPFLDLG